MGLMNNVIKCYFSHLVGIGHGGLGVNGCRAKAMGWPEITSKAVGKNATPLPGHTSDGNDWEYNCGSHPIYIGHILHSMLCYCS